MTLPTSTVDICDAHTWLTNRPPASVHCAVTSPPYWRQRNYRAGPLELGQEPTVAVYVENLVKTLDPLRRVLRPDGLLFLNLGDTYKKGEMCGVPWRVGLELQANGWQLLQDVLWHKPNTLPTGGAGRRFVGAHEYVLMLALSPGYYFDQYANHEPAKTAGRRVEARGDGVINGSDGYESLATRCKRDVWTIPVGRSKLQHSAQFPPALVEPCILAGTSEHGCCSACGAPYRRLVTKERRPTRPGTNSTKSPDPQRHVTHVVTTGFEPQCECQAGPIPCVVADMFSGAGTVAMVARQLGRSFVGCELNPEYVGMSERRLAA